MGDVVRARGGDEGSVSYTMPSARGCSPGLSFCFFFFFFCRRLPLRCDGWLPFSASTSPCSHCWCWWRPLTFRSRAKAGTPSVDPLGKRTTAGDDNDDHDEDPAAAVSAVAVIVDGDALEGVARLRACVGDDACFAASPFFLVRARLPGRESPLAAGPVSWFLSLSLSLSLFLLAAVLAAGAFLDAVLAAAALSAAEASAVVGAASWTDDAAPISRRRTSAPLSAC